MVIGIENSSPRFGRCLPNSPDGKPGSTHTGTIHFLENTQQLEDAYNDSVMGIPSRRPFIEMTIPSSLDKTISPPGIRVSDSLSGIVQ